jgi:hypothetical protein
MEAFNQAVQQFFFQRKLDLKPNVSFRPFMPCINLCVDGSSFPLWQETNLTKHRVFSDQNTLHCYIATLLSSTQAV